jgi:antibiotic biosynthesis monooxygenase (ABM) superfamily enzyme
MTETPDFDSSATAVISHHVKADQQQAYEQWLCQIIPVCKRYPGHLGVQVIRPVTDATTTYTIIIRYETRMQLLAWMGSPERKQLVEKARPLLSEDDKFEVLSGLDFWFTPTVAKVKPPVRWKQFLLSWSVIYPLVLIVPVIIEPFMRHLTLLDNHYVRTLVISAIVVALVVYVIMPRYTKLVGRWLLR